MKKRIESLQVIRAIAFWGVFASHSGIEVFSACGAWAVSVFIILSGFLMYLSYGQSDRFRETGLLFSFKLGIGKVKKLYPLHLITMLLAIPTLIFGHYEHSGIWKVFSPIVKVVSQIFLVQAWIPKKEYYFSLNAVSWYLSLSVFLYMISPLILNVIKKYSGLKPAVFSIAGIFLVQIAMSYISSRVQLRISNEDFFHWFTYVFPVTRLEDFAIGCNLGYIYCFLSHDEKRSCKYTVLEAVVVAVIIAQCWLYYFLSSNTVAENTNLIALQYWWRPTAFWTVSSCMLILIFACNKGAISSALSNKFIVFIGNLSANAFLIHLMVYKYCREIEKHLFGTEKTYFNFVFCFVVTIICSYLWDKIINRIKNNKYNNLLDNN